MLTSGVFFYFFIDSFILSRIIKFGARDQTQGLLHTKHVFFQQSHTPNLHVYLGHIELQF